MNYLQQQQNYYFAVKKQVNPVSVEVIFPVVTSGGDYSDFTGDNERSEEDAPRFTLSCLYQRNFTEEQRTKQGIEKDVSAVVHIPALEVEKVTGNIHFPDELDTDKMIVKLYDTRYEVSRLIKQEPFKIGGKEAFIAYELRLRERSDNRGD